MAAAAASQALFGRDTEIASITAFLGRESHSDVGALILSGDAGVGKSALLDEAAGSAAASGYTVIRTAGAEAESEMGFAALTAVVHHIGTDTIAAVEPRYAQALEVALGVREARTPGARLLGEAVLAALNAAAGEENLLVIIDDLQALDPSSAVVLSYVARRLARSKVRLIGAARSDDAPLFEGAGIGALRVQPLPPASAEALLSHRFPRLSGRAQARILEGAAGNPLALIELPAAGADVTHSLSSDALPLTRRLQAVFARRLDGLSSSARALLLLCALEPSISLRELQQIGHVDDVLLALAPAETLRVVSIEPGGTTVRFRHPLTRAAVVGISTASDRRLAHLKLAEIAPSGSPGQAWHLAHAAIGTDDAIAALLERASRTSSSRGDVHGAIAAMIRAADLSSQPDERRRRMASAAYLSASLLGDLSDVPHMLDAPAPAAGAPLVAAVAASYHLLSATGSIDTAHKFLLTALEMTPGEFSPADETLLEAFYTWVRVCYFGNRASLWHDFDRLLARMPNPPAPLQLQVNASPRPGPHRCSRDRRPGRGDRRTRFGFRPAPHHPRHRGGFLRGATTGMPARPQSRRGGRPRRRSVATSHRRRLPTRHRRLPHGTLGRSRTASRRGARLVGGDRHSRSSNPPATGCVLLSPPGEVSTTGWKT